jgi:methylmalonyl-CoA mutase C-terminal domain/subunit
MTDSKIIRVLLAQFPLETHTKGMITVAGMLRDAGMEIVLLGNALPVEIAQAAVQEDVDVVGISSYCGGELVLGEKVLALAREEGIRQETVFILGGIFPPENAAKLKEMGFAATFPPSAKAEEIIDGIEKAMAAKNAG